METKLTAERREEHGKGVARKLRAAGRIPAVLYGHDQETVSLSVDGHDMFKVLHTSAGANVLVDLKVDSTEHLVLPREIQRNHIKGTIVHVDFLVVSRTETIQVNVEIVDVGEAPGVKQGGVVDHHLREVLVECFPQDVPEHLEADVSGLDLNDVLHVSDLVSPTGVTILTNPEETVLAVIVPAVLKTEADLTIAGEEPAVVEEPEAAEGEAAEGEGEGAPAEGEGEAASAEEGGEG